MVLLKKIKNWIHDYKYKILGTIKGVVYCNPPKHYLDYAILGKVSVVLIPGILCKWGFMKSLGDKISLLGHPVYIIPELGYNLFDIPKSAKILDELIKHLTARGKVGGIVLVSHSKGGLIGKYFLSHYNKDNKVLGMVAIATPFSGSAMANLLPFDPIKELRPDSKIVLDLEKHFDINKKIISIIPEYDNYIWAEKGSFLNGAENIEVPIWGHHKIIFDQKAQDVVLNSIEKITQNNKEQSCF